VIVTGLVILLIVVYEIGYWHGKQAHKKSLSKNIDLVRRIHEKNSQEDNS
jgi:hypothetical protein